MRVIGIIATIIFVWWAVNQVLVIVIMKTSPQGDDMKHIITWMGWLFRANVVAAIVGLFALIVAAFKNSA